MANSILLLTNRVPFPLNDGGNLAVKAMIDGYNDTGWNVHLLSMNTSRHYLPETELKGLYNNIAGFEVVDINNDIKFFDTLFNYLFSTQPSHAIRFQHQAFEKQLLAALKTIKPDVIQIESIFLTTYLTKIREVLPDTIVILRLHNIEYQVWQRFALETESFFKRIYLKNLAGRIKKFEEDAWLRYTLLLPITETDAALVRGSGIFKKMLVAPFGLNARDINDKCVETSWIGYHIGAMDWLPNKESLNWFLNDIWPDLHNEVPEFRFYFAGRQMPESYKKMKLEGAYCLGEVPDAASFIADKKILIVPLRSGGGIRVKILEAMAGRKVVISTDVGIQGIDATPGRHYLAANTKEEFITAVKWCMENKTEAAHIGDNAAQLIKEKYDQDAIMKKLNVKLGLLLDNKSVYQY